MKPCLYIFLDEAGNFDFSDSGSKYFTLSSLARIRPFGVYPELTELKYDLLESNSDIEYFHASHDRQAVRNEVFKIIGKHISDFKIDAMVIKKSDVPLALRDVESFYCTLLGRLLRGVLDQYELTGYSQVLIMSDRLPDTGRSKLEKAIKSTLKADLPEAVSYRILHHQSRSNFNLQIVDYCNWAIFRKWEREDGGSYDLIAKCVRSELLFRT